MRFQIPDDGDAFMKIICVLEAGGKTGRNTDAWKLMLKESWVVHGTWCRWREGHGGDDDDGEEVGIWRAA